MLSALTVEVVVKAYSNSEESSSLEASGLQFIFQVGL